ncbi:MAG TPA: ABC transporter substrate-binding protein [Acidimicrobiales bacterium]|nr:ABC transporter substrate-binding protein [Acidimicrobiales bacterium]
MARSFDRRSFLAQSAAVAAGVVGVTAAGDLLFMDGPLGAVTNGPGRNGVSRARPKRGGKLVFGTTAEEQGFNPSVARFDSVGVMYARTVFDPLAIITADGKVAPYLAQSITPNADYTSWTVTLRPTVVFHDGTPCDGAALLANFEAQYDSLLIGLVMKPIVATMAQSGPLAVTVNLKQPWVPFPYYLAGGIGGQVAYPMAPAMIKAKTGTTNPIGTGPFTFQSWVPNTHFTAVANKRYWRKGLPYLDSITFKPIPNANTRAQALQSGTIDIMVTDVPQNIVQFRGKSQWAYIDDSGPVVGEPDMNLLMLNLAQPPFDDPTVRLAAAKAVSPKQYSAVIDLGVNPPSTGLFVKGTPYYSPTKLPTYDPAGAKKLVAKVQRATGKPVAFTIGCTTGPASIRSATYVRDHFQSVGFKVTTAVMEQNKLIDNALTGKFQASEWRQFSAVNPDLNYIYWSTTTYNQNGLSINMARNNDPRVEAALQVGRTSLTAQARIAAYQKVNQLFAQDLPYLWADRAVWAVVAHPTVQNFNNPTTPSGAKAYGMIAGSIWPTQIWRS